MRFEISRVSAQIEPQQFLDEFYLPRRPVIVEGVARDWPATHQWTPDYLRSELDRSRGRASRQLLWWDIGGSFLFEHTPEPFLIEALRERQAPHERTRSRRLWMSTRGERTPWHYDGNSLEVFNVQISGSKRFTLVSPETPIPAAAFSLLGRSPNADPESLLSDRHDHTSFVLGAGDMLYLPRYWFHHVESLAEFNSNINWVWTDLKSGPFDNPVSVRERELMAGLFPLFAVEQSMAPLGSALGLPRLRLKHCSPEYAREYGGGSGFEVPRSFLRERGWVRAGKAVVRELVASIRPGAVFQE